MTMLVFAVIILGNTKYILQEGICLEFTESLTRTGIYPWPLDSFLENYKSSTKTSLDN